MGARTVRVERIGDATLYLADCRDVGTTEMAGVAPDVVISDPPFSIPHNFSPQSYANGGTRALSWDWDRDLSVESILAVFAPWFVQAKSAFVFCGLRQATPLAELLSASGMVDKMAAWVKRYPAPPGLGNWWPSAFQLAVYGYRHKAFFGDRDPKRSNVFTADAMRFGNPEKNGHPTQTPLAVMGKIARALVSPSAVIIDPFMGSGTTGVAVLRQGGRFIGIEKEQQWFDLACERISAETRQGKMLVGA
jgi:site-specific DNA-methyltransferase (adenine-specific)